MIDHVSGAIKLIDPKSDFNNKKKVYGLIDPNYDLSKLNHSFKYLYDCIVNNLYLIKYDKENINLKIFVPKAYQYINDNFEYIIINKFIDLATKELNASKIEVTTAKPVSNEMLQKLFGESKYTIKNIVDDSIIGGIKIKHENTIIDNSIIYQLSQLKKTLHNV